MTSTSIALMLWAAATATAQEPTEAAASTEPVCDAENLQAEIVALRTRLARYEALSPDLGEVPSIEAPATEPAWGLELGLASTYVDGGENVFSELHPWEHHAAFMPGVSWTHAGTGLSVSYGGVFQLVGDNAEALVATGVGHEQALSLGVERPLLGDEVLVAIELNTKFFPFADPKITDVIAPAFVEPAVTLSWERSSTLSLGLSYENGLQKALWGEHSFKVEPGYSLSLPVSSAFSTTLDAHVAASLADALDLEGGVDLTAEFDLIEGVVVAPALHLAWSGPEVETPSESAFIWWDLVLATGF